MATITEFVKNNEKYLNLGVLIVLIISMGLLLTFMTSEIPDTKHLNWGYGLLFIPLIISLAQNGVCWC
jgi:hypothetical protein